MLKLINREKLKQTIPGFEGIKEEKPVASNALGYDGYLFLNNGRRAKFVKVASIKCFLASDVFSKVLTETGKKFLLLKSLAECETKLPHSSFMCLKAITIKLFWKKIGR